MSKWRFEPMPLEEAQRILRAGDRSIDTHADRISAAHLVDLRALRVLQRDARPPRPSLHAMPWPRLLRNEAPAMSASSLEQEDRNWTIYWRYMTGDTASVLARAFGISTERVTQIVRRQWMRRRRQQRKLEREYLYSQGLGFLYLEERERQRRELLAGRQYRVRPGSRLRVQDWS